MPSTFVVEASQTSQGNRFDAKDPVCNSSPILYWNNTFIILHNSFSFMVLSKVIFF
jgi:hypothetical protein